MQHPDAAARIVLLLGFDSRAVRRAGWSGDKGKSGHLDRRGVTWRSDRQTSAAAARLRRIHSGAGVRGAQNGGGGQQLVSSDFASSPQ